MQKLEDKIVEEARSWVNTKFHHRGRVKNIACDCLGLIMGVAKNLLLKTPENRYLHEYDIINYSKFIDGQYFMDELDKYLINIDINEARRGDVLLFSINENPQHLAIISEKKDQMIYIIHCYLPARKVIEHHVDEYWGKRIVKAYRFYNVIREMMPDRARQDPILGHYRPKYLSISQQ